METSNSIKDALQNWIPIKITSNQDGLLCQWLYTGDKPFNNPFFDETIRKCLSLPENSKGYRVNTTLELIQEWAACLDSVTPTAFIFHVSRCGSTLVSQALGMMSNSISLSEVALFDQILRLPNNKQGIIDQCNDKLLAAAIQFYGNKRTGAENRLFIKTDSWHLLYYQRLRALYPNVPFIILYREPAGVLESNKRSSGMQGIANFVGPEVYGFDITSDEFFHPDNYMALVLEKFFNCIIEIATNDKHTLLLNYNQGLNEMMKRIAAFIGQDLNAEEKAMIDERSKYHAKRPEKKFVEMNNSEFDHPMLEKLKGLYEEIEQIKNTD